jgi:acylphosphatase
MNYKPDEATLISYLYGELDATESEKVLHYLEQHPEVLKQLQTMRNALDVMRSVEDKEVIAPPIFIGQHSEGKAFWQSPYFTTVMSIAASFLFIILVGKLSGLVINYSSGELRMSFGGTSPQKQETVQSLNPELLTEDKVQEMIDLSLSKNNDVLATNWTNTQRKLDTSIKASLALNSKRMDDLMKNASQASEEQVRGFVSNLQTENLRLMKDYLQLSSKEQKQYVETLLVDFSSYLKEQRNQDLQLFQTRMTSIEKNTVQFKQETEQILASIISNTGPKKSSY